MILPEDYQESISRQKELQNIAKNINKTSLRGKDQPSCFQERILQVSSHKIIFDIHTQDEVHFNR